MPERLHQPAHFHLAVALDGAGCHPAAGREPDARPADLLTAGYWVDLVRRAARGPLHLVTPSTGRTVPLLQERGVFRTEDEETTPRNHLRPAPLLVGAGA